MLRSAVLAGQLSLSQITRLLAADSFGAPLGRSARSSWQDIERALDRGLLRVRAIEDRQTHLRHSTEIEVRPEAIVSEPEAVVDSMQSLAIIACDGVLAEGPLRFRYLLRGFEGQSVELRFHAEGLTHGPVHRRMLEHHETLDGPHDGEWDGIVTAPGSLADRRLPAGRGPCRVELFATDVYGDEAKFELAPPPAPTVVIAGHCFDRGHGILLPDVQAKAEHLVGRYRPAALTALARVLREALEGDPRPRLMVVGHSDTKGDPGANQSLSEIRAENVALYLQDAEGWSTHCANHAQLGDQQRALAWVHRRFAADYDCDPGPIDGKLGPKTRAAAAAFRDRYADLEGSSLPGKDEFEAPHWAALAVLYDRALDELLGENLALNDARAELVFADSEHLGYGESFPAREPGVDDNPCEDNRRVELILLGEDEQDLDRVDPGDPPGAWLHGPKPHVTRTFVRPTPPVSTSAEITVVERDQRPIAELRLELTDAAGCVSEQWTDERGRHRFDGLHPGPAQLRLVELGDARFPGLELEPLAELGPGEVEAELVLSLLDPPELEPSLAEFDTDTRTVVTLDRPVLHIPSPSLLHHDRGSALFVPSQSTQGQHPLAALVHPLVSLLDHPERCVFVVAHASALGSSSANERLADQRRDAVRAFVEGDAEAWVEIAEDASSLRDPLAYLDYLGRRRAWACTFEGELDSFEGEATDASAACVSEFQAEYNARFEGELEVDGVCGPKTFGAIFEVLRDEYERWLDKLGTSPDELPLGRVHYRAYGDELDEREAESSPAEAEQRAAHARRVDLILYEPGAADDAPEALELAELYDHPAARRLPFELPHEPDEWATGPFSIVSDLTEHETFEPETYRLRGEDGSIHELVIPDDAIIEAGEYVLVFERLPTDTRYTLIALSDREQRETTIFEDLSYGQLHAKRPVLEG